VAWRWVHPDFTATDVFSFPAAINTPRQAGDSLLPTSVTSFADRSTRSTFRPAAKFAIVINGLLSIHIAW
jgi:hypothetical protein